MGQQVPSRPVWLQLTHAPLQATLQQTPSVQKPLAQSASFAHTAARGLGPQLPFTHEWPPTQSPSLWQMETQLPLVLSQLNGAQIVAGPGLQRPSPSQTFAFVTEAPLQVPSWQIVPPRYFRQAPLPSQVPSRPQVDWADTGQMLAERGMTPAGTKVQTPGEPGTLQDLHVSVQALSQQRPSTQNPLWQSASQPHALPLAPWVPSLCAQIWMVSTGASAAPSALGLTGRPPHPSAASVTVRNSRALPMTPRICGHGLRSQANAQVDLPGQHRTGAAWRLNDIGRRSRRGCFWRGRMMRGCPRWAPRRPGR
jgi:hypothetical protein